MKKEIPRNSALFSIGVVEEITNLTARQIRYYEKHGLIRLKRNKGNQRLFSLADIERLLEVKKLIDQGINIAGVKAMFQSKDQEESMLPHKKEQNRWLLSSNDLQMIVQEVKKHLNQ